MQRSSESIGAIAAALAKAQAEITNPEKSLTATIQSPLTRKGERTFRYARCQQGSISSARRSAARDRNRADDCDRQRDRTNPSHHHSCPCLGRMDVLGLAGLPGPAKLRRRIAWEQR